MSELRAQDPTIFDAIAGERQRQLSTLELIASENYASDAVLEALGSVMNNKYAEGLPRKRYYGGCEFVDVAEEAALERIGRLFGAEHANVQAHSGASANLAAYLTVAEPGDTLLGMSLAHGGATHGHPSRSRANGSRHSGTGPSEDDRLDYDQIEALARASTEDPRRGGGAYPGSSISSGFGRIARGLVRRSSSTQAISRELSRDRSPSQPGAAHRIS
jgi:glycine hydroxymethyltransferase